MTDREGELLLKCAQGDGQAFSELYQSYSPAIYRFILTFVKSADLADDLCQEVFIKFWENRKGVAEIRSVKAYLYTIAKNHTLNMLQRASKETLAMGVILSNYHHSNATEDNLSTKEYLTYLDQVISTISPQSRAVFILCRQQQKSYDEVAELLGISRNAVKKHMVKSMKIISESVRRDLGLPLKVLLAVLLS